MPPPPGHVPAPGADLLAIEARRWADLTTQRQERTNWLRSPLVLRHVNTMVTGAPDTPWHEAATARFLPPARWGGAGLSLGCNDAGFERGIVRAGVCRTWDGYELSPEAVATARAAAASEGLAMRFHIADANAVELPADHYSLAVVIMALHHIERLEQVCARVHAALRRDGLFAFDEFVGPARFQWTAVQVDAANALRRRLPRELRRLPSGAYAGDCTVPDLARMKAEEPFEAIRSDEILPIVRGTFHVLAQRDYGGTALHLALDQILANFDEADPAHAALLQDLCAQERRWLATGHLPSDFTVVVAARKDAAPELLAAGDPPRG
jgi:SAM-dependent methyltransferase